MDWGKRIKKTMEKLHKEFDKNELAYLAFTSKVERPVRDKFAWILYKELKPQYDVVREYGETDRKKYDLVIRSKKQCSIEVVIEFKAISVPSQLASGWPLKALRSDAKKMKKLINGRGNRFFVLLVNLPEKRPEDDCKCYFAPSHYKRIRKDFDNIEENGDIETAAEGWMREWHEKLGDDKKDFEIVGGRDHLKASINAGNFCRNHMTILYSIVKVK